MQIPIFQGDGKYKYERLPMTFRTYEFNDPTDDKDESVQINETSVVKAWDAPLEPLAQRDGMESYDIRAMQTLIRMKGVLYARSFGSLMDRVRAFNEVFDPVVAYRTDGSVEDRGFLPLDFSVPTLDTTNYTTGLMPLRYYVRSQSVPIFRSSQFEGLSATFGLDFQAIDPRCYLQTLSTKTLVNGSNSVDNTLAEYPSYPFLTITMSGAGSSTFTFATSFSSLVLDLSGLEADDVVVVSFEKGEIKLNGTVDNSLYVSGAFTDLMPSSTTVNMSNITNAAPVLSWRRAFV